MPTTKRRVARKEHRCGFRAGHRITAGQAYLEHTVFPGDDAFEEIKFPRALRECPACSTRYGRAHLLEASHA